jgi:hypothetical protein
MSTWKLIGLTVAWILASVAIAVVISIVLTELLVLVGLVDWGTPEYSRAINGIALAAFVAVVSVPILFRKRFTDSPGEATGE